MYHGRQGGGRGLKGANGCGGQVRRRGGRGACVTVAARAAPAQGPCAMAEIAMDRGAAGRWCAICQPALNVAQLAVNFSHVPRMNE